MRAKVDPDLCIGCGVCIDMAPDVFELEDDIAVVRLSMIREEDKGACEEAKDACPVDAIELED